MRNLSVLVFGAILLTACSDKKNEENVIEKHISNEEASSLKEEVSAKIENGKQAIVGDNRLIVKGEKDLSKQVIDKNNGKSHSKNIMINEQKFELQSSELIKGSKVFNFLMSQSGIVKGTFVVITNNVDTLSRFESTAKIIEIAQSTYRLTPEKDADFSEYYKLLQRAKQFKRVEMEIDYSGKTRRPLTEES
jgi:hypothetical protein